MSRARRVFLTLLTALAVFTLYIFGEGQSDGPGYTLFSAGPDGVSLLYDTLQRLGFPVAPAYGPLDSGAGVNDVYIVISPGVISDEEAREMAGWAARGGRLVFFDNDYPTPMDSLLDGYPRTDFGNCTHYTVGLGEVLTGYSGDVTNQSLAEDSAYGTLLSWALNAWGAENIYFAEYYHGYRGADNFFARLPLAVKLCIYQLIILTLAYMGYKAKRLGKPVPYYEETERAGDEHVRALALLYWKAGIDPGAGRDGE